MRPILLIALNTFKETIRNRTLYSILFFAGVLILLSVSFGEWSVLARVQVMQDFGLGTLSIAGLMLAIFIGVGLLGKEISSKTAYHLLTKPISRAQFIWGKFIGLIMTLTLNYLLMAAFLFGVLLALDGSFKPELCYALALTWAEMTIIVAAAIFFSTFATPTLAAMFTLGMFAAGHFNDLLEFEMVREGSTAHAFILKSLYYLLPNLDHFNIRTQVVYDLQVSPEYVGFTFLYGCLFSVLLMVFATAIFSRKDL